MKHFHPCGGCFLYFPCEESCDLVPGEAHEETHEETHEEYPIGDYFACSACEMCPPTHADLVRYARDSVRAAIESASVRGMETTLLELALVPLEKAVEHAMSEIEHEEALAATARRLRAFLEAAGRTDIAAIGVGAHEGEDALWVYTRTTLRKGHPVPERFEGVRVLARCVGTVRPV